MKVILRSADFIDPKDNYLLDLSKTVGADFLVTGDKPLLNLDFYGTTQIISYRKFCELLEAV
ncbi:MAG: hypothetical protein ACKVU0_10025 [Saprospiraceae bacterium]